MFCHAGETEIGGFGISSADDPLRIEEFVTVRQKVSPVTVSFDDDAVAEFFDHQVDAGRRPEQFARIWLHTHPGDSPMPSSTDEQTFARVFGSCNWAVMFILARGGATYARLRFNLPPAAQVRLPVEVLFAREFAASDQQTWIAEYEQNIHPDILSFSSTPTLLTVRPPKPGESRIEVVDPLDCYQEGDDRVEVVIGEMERMSVTERDQFWNELTARPDLWGEEGASW
jgi:proteasome lid subunit RPN8/RPN11